MPTEQELTEQLDQACKDFRDAKLGERQQAWKKRKAIAEELFRVRKDGNKG
jgi:hypothetical protein